MSDSVTRVILGLARERVYCTGTISFDSIDFVRIYLLFAL